MLHRSASTRPPRPDAEAGVFVPPHLVAMAAGISFPKMQRIASNLASGRWRTWRGAKVEVQGGSYGGRKLRLDTLPEPVRKALNTNEHRFMVAHVHAAETRQRPGSLHRSGFLVLADACSTIPLSDATFDALLVHVAGAPTLFDLDQGGFDRIADWLFALGFRHRTIPAIGADLLAALDVRDWRSASTRASFRRPCMRLLMSTLPTASTGSTSPAFGSIWPPTA